MSKIIGFAAMLLFFGLSLSYAQEQLTITTYYPSPYGVYNELRTYRHTHLATESGFKVGIGTTTPDQKLQIDDANDPMVLIRDTTNPTSAVLQATNGYGGVGTVTNHPFYIMVNTTGVVAIGTNHYVGIGIASPTYRLELPNTADNAGRGYAYEWVGASSIRWKTNIKPIENALEKVLELRGVEFEWKENGKKGIGLIAEEVGEIFPEVVSYEDNGKDAKGLSYGHLVAVLVEAIKAQQKEIDTLKKEVARIKIQLNPKR